MKKGFTLLELIVVLVIIAILTTLVGLKLTGVTGDAQETRIETDLALLLTACERYGLNDGDPALTTQEELVNVGVLSQVIESPFEDYTYVIYAAKDGAWVRLEKDGVTYERKNFYAEKISSRFHTA